jgi:beta-galactosidase
MKSNYLYKLLFAVCLSLFATMSVEASDGPRRIINLNDGWGYKPLTSNKKNAPLIAVTLPHTWNVNYLPGTTTYNREMMVYCRQLNVTQDMLGKRLFLYFEGANSVADVFINHTTVGEHKGGYTAFCYEITKFVHSGNNDLEVWVNNAYRTDVLPISGDFNIYGGLTRPVHLIITGKDCISPTFFASPGVLIHQDKISSEEANITVETLLSFSDEKSNLTVCTSITDASGHEVARSMQAVDSSDVRQKIKIEKPHLWNGKANPYLYNVKVQLLNGKEVIDEVNQPAGLRYFKVDSDKGFFLNGRYLDLHGFCRHEDFSGHGSALTMKEYREDMDIIRESGATAMRLAHYPHGKPMYDLSDSTGIILMTEIPMCGPGGYAYTGYLKSVEQNAVQVAQELVYQYYNHPSIVFWGIFNELLLTDSSRFVGYDNPIPFVKEINNLYHQQDPTRLTIVASCMHEKDFLGCSDVMAWNKYFGWRSAEKDASAYFDGARKVATPQPIGVSEYGAAGSLNQHADPLYSYQDTFPSTYHPEEYQAVCHEGYWSAFAKRPWLYTKFIWQFADMQSSIRKEGDKDGMNDKGMVTYDRKTRKDVFYFYKANWNPQPMLWLTGRRFTVRNHEKTDIKAYSNLKEATLYVNNKKIGTQQKDDICRIIWHGVSLSPGENVIRVEGNNGKHKLSDSITLIYNR